jgi:hypothetical protein
LSSHKTNNSRKAEKTNIRKEVIWNINKKNIFVLDAFAGKSILWGIIKLVNNKKITVLGIDKNESDADIYGDNIKVLPCLNLEKFDIIDLDAWGCPYDQIRLIFENKTLAKGTYVIYTYIITGMGGANRRLLKEIGITDKMTKKAPLLCAKKQNLAFDQFLHKNGIKHVTEIEVHDGTSKKRYGYFKIPE